MSVRLRTRVRFPPPPLPNEVRLPLRGSHDDFVRIGVCAGGASLARHAGRGGDVAMQDLAPTRVPWTADRCRPMMVRNGGRFPDRCRDAALHGCGGLDPAAAFAR